MQVASFDDLGEGDLVINRKRPDPALQKQCVYLISGRLDSVVKYSRGINMAPATLTLLAFPVSQAGAPAVTFRGDDSLLQTKILTIISSQVIYALE